MTEIIRSRMELPCALIDVCNLPFPFGKRGQAAAATREDRVNRLSVASAQRDRRTGRVYDLIAASFRAEHPREAAAPIFHRIVADSSDDRLQLLEAMDEAVDQTEVNAVDPVEGRVVPTLGLEPWVTAGGDVGLAEGSAFSRSGSFSDLEAAGGWSATDRFETRRQVCRFSHPTPSVAEKRRSSTRRGGGSLNSRKASMPD